MSCCHSTCVCVRVCGHCVGTGRMTHFYDVICPLEQIGFNWWVVLQQHAFFLTSASINHTHAHSGSSKNLIISAAEWNILHPALHSMKYTTFCEWFISNCTRTLRSHIHLSPWTHTRAAIGPLVLTMFAEAFTTWILLWLCSDISTLVS